MKKNILFLLAVFASVQVLGQSNGNFRVVTVRDSIYLAGVWIKQFSHDSTLGDGDRRIVPSQYAVKAAIDKKVNDTAAALRALIGTPQPDFYTSNGAFTSHRTVTQGQYALNMLSEVDESGTIRRSRLYKDAHSAWMMASQDGGSSSTVVANATDARLGSFDPVTGVNNQFMVSTTGFSGMVSMGEATITTTSTANSGGANPYHEVSVTNLSSPDFTKIRLDLNTVTVNGNLNFANYPDAEGGKFLGTDNAGNVILKSSAPIAIKVLQGNTTPSYTPTKDDQLIYCLTGTGAITINLPEPLFTNIGNGKEFIIKCNGTNSVNIMSPPPGVDYGGTLTLTDGKYVRIVSSTVTGAWILVGGN